MAIWEEIPWTPGLSDLILYISSIKIIPWSFWSAVDYIASSTSYIVLVILLIITLWVPYFTFFPLITNLNFLRTLISLILTLPVYGMKIRRFTLTLKVNLSLTFNFTFIFTFGFWSSICVILEMGKTKNKNVLKFGIKLKRALSTCLIKSHLLYICKIWLTAFEN